MAERTDGIIKTQLAKFREAFNLPWPKVLPIILLNLRSTPFKKHKLLSFEIITRRPMRLSPEIHEPLLIKGEMLEYYKGLEKP